MGTVNSVRYTIGKLWYMVPVGVPFHVNLSCFLLDFYGNQKYGIRLVNYGIRCWSGWDFPVPFLSLHNTVSSSPMAEPWVGVACPKANPHYWRSRLMKEKEELNRNWESTLSWIKNWRCEERLRANQENNHFLCCSGSYCRLRNRRNKRREKNCMSRIMPVSSSWNSLGPYGFQHDENLRDIPIEGCN